MYGPPFRPPIPAEAISTRSKDAYPAEHHGRARHLAAVGLRIHQAVGRQPVRRGRSTRPTRPPTCGRRNTTTVPTQNLALLNDPFVRGLRPRPGPARSPRSRTGAADRVRRAYELALGRPPRDGELTAALAFLARGSTAPTAFADFCHVLFTLNEFLYID